MSKLGELKANEDHLTVATLNLVKSILENDALSNQEKVMEIEKSTQMVTALIKMRKAVERIKGDG